MAEVYPTFLYLYLEKGVIIKMEARYVLKRVSAVFWMLGGCIRDGYGTSTPLAFADITMRKIQCLWQLSDHCLWFHRYGPHNMRNLYPPARENITHKPGKLWRASKRSPSAMPNTFLSNSLNFIIALDRSVGRCTDSLSLLLKPKAKYKKNPEDVLHEICSCRTTINCGRTHL